jgi:biopolymer transport protein ExbB/TolQ
VASVIDWGSVADWVVAVTAIFGVGFAIRQLNAVRGAEEKSATSNKQAAAALAAQVQIARATIILEIDRRFEDAEMLGSRIAIRALRNRAIREAEANLRDGVNQAEISDKADELFSGYVTKLWRSFRTADSSEPALDATKAEDRLSDVAGAQYSQLTRLLGWMETVGRLTEQNLVPAEDMFALYDAVFLQVYGLFESHIADRRSEPPNPNDLWLEKAEWFRDAANNRAQGQKALTKPTPTPSSLNWGDEHDRD